MIGYPLKAEWVDLPLLVGQKVGQKRKSRRSVGHKKIQPPLSDWIF
jgi:hypothetical protein